MTRLDIEMHDDAVSVINKIKNINDEGLELHVPDGSVLFDNIINLKLIKEYADRQQKTVHFATSDEVGINLISAMEEPGTQSFGFQPNSQQTAAESNYKNEPPRFRKSFKFPAFNFSAGKGKFLIPLVVLIILGLGLWKASTLPKAEAKIIVNSQPLTRSITIKAKTGANTNADTDTLKAQTLTTSVEVSDSIATTGEKQVGKKASGEAVIYNKTDEEVKLKKGHKLTYENDDKEYAYVTKDDVTISKCVEALDPADPCEPSSKNAKIEAVDIGDKYNIDDGKTLSIDDYKSSEMAAKTKGKVSGGESKTVKTVAEADKTTLQKKIQQTVLDKATADLKTKVAKTQTLIEGSTLSSVTKETYGAAVGDEAETLTLATNADAKGLIYLNSELNSLLDKKVQSFIPEGFELSEKNRSVSVSVLGNSSTSVLSADQADLQVTLKTYIVPKIDIAEVKKQMAGKSMTDAQGVLGAIKNVNNYSLTINPAIPLFKKVPKDLNRISIEISND